ncbi:MAG TPA: NrfD/PsrC family molybdoenzyme membrane anchor subunit [Bryobacteraceae bacterium]|jgi:molybdopterin-containing oxidoreductase family membrane subunit|nr:NrfD/PsrC family molybdoenzyme membrane anchor subunit [Bryobacteraceae bacterium]
MSPAPELLPYRQIREDLFRPLSRVSRQYVFATVIAFLVGAAGLAAWGLQLHSGMGVTGLQRPVFWGIYIVDFVFWIGISHAGTLISAILRLTGAAWRKPVTRAAEAITVFALMIGGMFPIIHLGRAWLFYWLLPYPNSRMLWPNFRSPLLWDLTAIVTYVTGSVIYLYLPLIPDLAQLAEHNTPWRQRLYRALSLGWTGSDREWHALERAMKLMACIILAVAVSVHTVVAWDFAMAIAPMWHSTIFGPYFVTGAIFSGIAALILVMAIIRKLLHLEVYLTKHHFDRLAKLLLLMSLLWCYFTLAENLTVWYGNDPKEMAVFGARTRGHYAPYFWSMMFLNFAVPFVLLGIRRLRSIASATVASVSVLIGMWIERFVIVVPTLANPRLPSASGFYTPTWVEAAITAATFAAMAMLYMIFAKLFPMIAVWEFKPHPQEDN